MNDRGFNNPEVSHETANSPYSKNLCNIIFHDTL